jgi:hypothetical protein
MLHHPMDYSKVMLPVRIYNTTLGDTEDLLYPPHVNPALVPANKWALSQLSGEFHTST